MFDLLSCCSGQLGLQGLALVAASSKLLQHICITLVRSDTKSLLLNTVKQAAAEAATSGTVPQQHTQAVLWLLKTAPTKQQQQQQVCRSICCVCRQSNLSGHCSWAQLECA
jgi:hypothetical protein